MIELTSQLNYWAESQFHSFFGCFEQALKATLMLFHHWPFQLGSALMLYDFSTKQEYESSRVLIQTIYWARFRERDNLHHPLPLAVNTFL